MSAPPDHGAARGCFPALAAAGAAPTASRPVLLDNAGGSQVPQSVVDRVADYLAHSYVQLGADYALSRGCTATVDAGRRLALRTLGGEGLGDAVLGPSTSVLCAALAQGFARADGQPKRVVVADGGHESNIGPWVRLRERGWDVAVWETPTDGGALDLDALQQLLAKPTAVVAVHHVSNILGRVEPIADIARIAREHGARTVVDGVAYAPHRAIDVRGLGCDFYVYSTYKVYGPHMAALFGTADAWRGLPGPNHGFLADGPVPYRWELGGANHEGCAGLLGTGDYLRFVADGATPASEHRDDDIPRPTIERAMARMAEWEAPLTQRLVAFVQDHPRLRLVGPGANPNPAAPNPAGDDRVATVSFVHAARPSAEIARELNRRHLAARFGHFYAHRLVQRLGLATEDGVVRASLVHYNTEDDVDRLLSALQELA